MGADEKILFQMFSWFCKEGPKDIFKVQIRNAQLDELFLKLQEIINSVQLNNTDWH